MRLPNCTATVSCAWIRGSVEGDLPDVTRSGAFVNPFRKLLGRLGTAHADHKSIARGMAWVVLFVVLGKLIGAAKEMAIAWRFGTGAQVDAYIFVLNLLSWPAAILFSVFTSVLIPSFAQMREHTPAQIPRFRAELIGMSLLVSLGTTGLAWVATPVLLRSSWSGLSPATAEIAAEMVTILAPTAGLGILVGLCSVFMLSMGRHANTLLEGVPALVLLLAIMVLTHVEGRLLAWGTLAGICIHFLALAVPLAMWRNLAAPRFSISAPQWSNFSRQFGVMLVGVAAMNGAVLMDQFFASHLRDGAIAILSYANRILALLSGVGAMAIMRATLPVFSQARARGAATMRSSALWWAGIAFTGGFVIAWASWAIAPSLVQILFEHGAFSPQDSIAVSEVLRAGITQIPFYFGGLVFVSVLASQQSFFTIAFIGCVNLVVKFLVNIFLIPVCGLSALMYSTTAMLGVSFLLLLAVVYRTSPNE